MQDLRKDPDKLTTEDPLILAAKHAIEALSAYEGVVRKAGLTFAFGNQAIKELQEAIANRPTAKPAAWRTFDGEGGYEYRTYQGNEDYLDSWIRLNPKQANFVDLLHEGVGRY